MVDNFRKKSRISGKMKLAITFSTVLLAVLWFVTSGWFWEKPVRVQSTELIMDTSFTVTVFAKNKKTGEKLLNKAFSEAKRIEHVMEPLQGDGELRRLNARTEDSWWIMSSDLKTVLNETLNYYKRSEGAFDPTIAPVKWLWDFKNGGRIPSAQKLDQKLALVGMSQIEIRDDSLRIRNPDVKLDLGGVAKGYAVDRMLSVLKAGGVYAGLVNAGGDIAMFGKKPGNKDWIIGLRHPRMSRTLSLGSMPYTAVATSGDYERFFIEDGVRYHHILDPSTGYPARECISVTTWAMSAMDADILSTTIFVLGQEKGLAFAEKLDNIEAAIFIEKDNKVGVVMTSGIKNRIKL